MIRKGPVPLYTSIDETLIPSLKGGALALSEPVPGWIRGFRMAEPVIIGYGRGLLKEFPGIPEGVEMPAPLSATACSALRSNSPANLSSSGIHTGNGIMLLIRAPASGPRLSGFAGRSDWPVRTAQQRYACVRRRGTFRAQA